MAEVPPILLSAVICDRVIFDKISGKPSLINIIQHINAPQYPIRHGQLVYFCEMTDGHGTTNMKIKLIDAQDNDKVLFEQRGTVEFKNVQQIVTLAMNMQGVIFPTPGEYRFQLFAEEHLLGERRVICRKIQLPPKDQGSAPQSQPEE